MKGFIRAAFLLSTLALPLAACSNGNFDPTDALDVDFLNTKKPLPGVRKEVFPEGTPGVPHGVPPELVRGYQPSPSPSPAPEAANDPSVQAGLPRDDTPPKPKAKPKPKPQPKVVAVPQGQPTSVTVRPSASPFPAPSASPQQPGGAAPTGAPGGVQWPDPPSPSR